MHLSYRPTLDKQEIRRRLAHLLNGSALEQHAVGRRIERVADSFRRYAGAYPLPLWAPGLLVTNEMRGLTEALLPLAEVAAVFDYVLTCGCLFAPMLTGSYLHSCASWLDFLQKFRPQLPQADPSVVLRQLAGDPQRRERFLFALLLPHHFGGAFDRYPLQAQWLESWLAANRERLQGKIRALDSACGSGEGSYLLAEQVSAAGYRADGSAVHGSTIEPIELFAGAHAFFPHDEEREREYRGRVAPLVVEGAVPIEFYLDEVGRQGGARQYDLILCNGLLGGPLLHEPAHLNGAIRALADRLAPGGVLLAADRFHAGWRRRLPTASLTALLSSHGLKPIPVPEGIAGSKPA